MLDNNRTDERWKKVGVSSNSHEAIKNLLFEIERQAKAESFKFENEKG